MIENGSENEFLYQELELSKKFQRWTHSILALPSQTPGSRQRVIVLRRPTQSAKHAKGLGGGDCRHGIPNEVFFCQVLSEEFGWRSSRMDFISFGGLTLPVSQIKEPTKRRACTTAPDFILRDPYRGSC